MVLGEETQITVGKEPPPVHSHFSNVDAKVLRVRNTRLFFFGRNSHPDSRREFRSKDACMWHGSNDVALSPLIAFFGGLHAKSLQSCLTLCSPIDCILWRRQWQPTPVLLPGKSHGRRSLGRLQSMGSQRVRHDWETSLSLFTFMHWRRKWQPTPVF